MWSILCLQCIRYGGSVPGANRYGGDFYDGETKSASIKLSLEVIQVGFAAGEKLLIITIEIRPATV